MCIANHYVCEEKRLKIDIKSLLKEDVIYSLNKMGCHCILACPLKLDWDIISSLSNLSRSLMRADGPTLFVISGFIFYISDLSGVLI